MCAGNLIAVPNLHVVWYRLNGKSVLLFEKRFVASELRLSSRALALGLWKRRLGVSHTKHHARCKVCESIPVTGPFVRFSQGKFASWAREI